MTGTPLDGLTPRLATRPLKGVTFPVVVKNMNYFLTDLGVYEDGIVECWGGVDLPMFRRKIESGRVRTEIPDGETLSAHHLAHMVVSEAIWHMTPETLIDRIEAILTALNPDRTNLYDMQGSETRTEGKMRVQKVSRMRAPSYRADERMPLIARPLKGHTQKAFWRSDDHVAVADITLFEDDVVRVTGAGDPVTLTLDDLRTDARLSEASKGDRVVIPGLCTFTAKKVEFTLPPADFLAEMEIDRDRMAGRETPLESTRKAFKAYQDDPTEATLQALRDAYESVPNHLRRYCGDQDVKDIPIRIALYGEKEIENWSHYAVAKARGNKLPSITVPKPKD